MNEVTLRIRVNRGGKVGRHGRLRLSMSRLERGISYEEEITEPGADEEITELELTILRPWWSFFR